VATRAAVITATMTIAIAEMNFERLIHAAATWPRGLRVGAEHQRVQPIADDPASVTDFSGRTRLGLASIGHDNSNSKVGGSPSFEPGADHQHAGAHPVHVHETQPCLACVTESSSSEC